MIRWWRGYSCCRKAGRDSKLNVSSFIKGFFVLKVVINFRELIRKKKLGRVWVKGSFGMTCFMEKILTIM